MLEASWRRLGVSWKCIVASFGCLGPPLEVSVERLVASLNVS